MGPRPFVLLAVLALAGAPAGAAQCHLAGTAARVALVELYTSEGCSSCPPADRWFSRLAPAREAVVPLAFHVDYWDSLGWTDRFASPAWSARQREAVRRSGARYAYTPQVMRNGRDFPRWSAGGALRQAAAAEGPAPVRLDLAVSVDAGTVRASVQAAATGRLAGGERVFVAVTESGLATDVRAGENRGERLAHDHVVRALADAGPVDSPSPLAFAVGRGWNPSRLAVAAFVQDPRTGEVLQAARVACAP